MLICILIVASYFSARLRARDARIAASPLDLWNRIIGRESRLLDTPQSETLSITYAHRKGKSKGHRDIGNEIWTEYFFSPPSTYSVYEFAKSETFIEKRYLNFFVTNRWKERQTLGRPVGTRTKKKIHIFPSLTLCLPFYRLYLRCWDMERLKTFLASFRLIFKH